MENLLGAQLQLFIGADASGSTASAQTIACATDLTVSVDRDSIDVSCKDCGAFGANIGGTINWSISTSNLYTLDGYRSLMNYVLDGTPIMASWSSVKNYASAMAAGGDEDGHIFNSTTKAETKQDLYKGWVTVTSIELNAANGDVASYTATFSGKGAIMRDDGNSSH